MSTKRLKPPTGLFLITKTRVVMVFNFNEALKQTSQMKYYKGWI